MKMIIYILPMTFIMMIISSCDPEKGSGDSFPGSILFNGYISGAPDVFIAFLQTNYNASRKITQVGLGSGVSDIVWIVPKPDCELVHPFSSFSIKYYSADITNQPGWNRYYQDDLETTNIEHLVYFSTNFTSGASIPELYNPGNSLPFYLNTNNGCTITTKSFQTNR